MTVDELEQKIRDIVFGKGWESDKFYQQRKNGTESFHVEWIVRPEMGFSSLCLHRKQLRRRSCS